MSFSNPILGGTTLVRPAIQSPNFSQVLKTGWAIMANGSAFFFSVTVGGKISGADILAYSGTPGVGTLVGSVSGSGGSDSFGNTYPSGLGYRDPSSPDALVSVGLDIVALGNNVSTALGTLAALPVEFLEGVSGPLPHQTTSNNTISTTAGTLSNADRVSINGLVNAVNTLQSNLQANGFEL